MNQHSDNTHTQEGSFLELFYNTLFSPEAAAHQIQFLREAHSTKLFIYSVLIVLLSSLGLSVSEGGVGFIFQATVLWLLQVLLLTLLAWLFRPEGSKTDFGLVFFYCAFAQAPLVFLGLAKLWANSPLIPTTLPTVICFAWSICLWAWAISNSLQISNFRAGIIVLLAILAPVLAVVALFAFILIFIISLVLG